MGEVYRATDTNLKRQVAIKVLPASVAGDTDRLARLQREAEVLAALNHPNIVHIHGLEKTDGTIALVMELVEGPTLEDRITQGAIPLDEALPIAKQIAEALEAAHEQGIIHRDLKPANIKVRPDGTVKVLDFGLAKALDQGPVIGDQGSGGAANSPTITTPGMTMRGVILGTAAYMSHEQARGKVVDRRTDIWAFGCVLYEMLAGARAFEGDDVTEILGAIVKTEPDWSRLPATTPRAIRTLITRCLAKDRTQRLQHIGDARLEIATAIAGESAEPAPSVAIARGRLMLVGGFGLLAGALAEAAESPAFSPDGQWVAFRRRNQFMKISTEGGSLQPIGIAPMASRGLVWADDGLLVFGQVSGGLFAIPVSGGVAKPFLDLETGEQSHRFPTLIKGTDVVLYRSLFTEPGSNWLRTRIMAFHRRTGVRKAIVDPGEGAEYMDSGHLVWVADGRAGVVARRVPHLLQGGRRTAASEPSDSSGADQEVKVPAEANANAHDVSTSPDGKFIAMNAIPGSTGEDILVAPLDGGAVIKFADTPANEFAPSFSPDGRWLSYVSDESGRPEVYVRAFPGPGGTWQVSTDGGTEPVWARGGNELFYRHDREMMSVAVKLSPTFAPGGPVRLFEGSYAESHRSHPNYDVARDGQRFLMIKDQAMASPLPIQVEMDIFPELRRLAPRRQ